MDGRSGSGNRPGLDDRDRLSLRRSEIGERGPAGMSADGTRQRVAHGGCVPLPAAGRQNAAAVQLGRGGMEAGDPLSPDRLGREGCGID